MESLSAMVAVKNEDDYMAGCFLSFFSPQPPLPSLWIFSIFSKDFCDYKDLESMKIEELQGSLDAYELRMNERTPEKSTDQALQAKVSKQWKCDRKKGWRGKGQVEG